VRSRSLFNGGVAPVCCRAFLTSLRRPALLTRFWSRISAGQPTAAWPRWRLLCLELQLDIPLRIVTEGAATERRMALTFGIDNCDQQRGFSRSRASSILGDWCYLRVPPLSLESFWPATPKSGRGSFGPQTSNQSRARPLIFHAAKRFPYANGFRS
jgi:hypothetical protein